MKETKTHILVFRHGDTDKKKYGDVFYGVSIPVDLSRHGVQQLHQLGRFFQRFHIHSVYHSPLKRARQSVDAFHRGYHGFWKWFFMNFFWFLRNTHTVPALTDVEYPSLEGKPVENGKILLEDGTLVDLDEIDAYADEPLAYAGRRFATTLLHIARRDKGRIAAIVSHGDPIAHGLYALQHPSRSSTNLLLERQGEYLKKGEFALVTVSYPLERVEVIFNPTDEQLQLM